MLVGERKLAGILAQVAGDGVVIGVGLNVSTTARRTAGRRPPPRSPSPARPAALDRTALLAAILAELGTRYTAWTDAGGDAAGSGLADDYRARCATIGRAVTVSDRDR